MECTVKIQGKEVTMPLEVFKNHLARVLDTKQKLGIEAKVDPAIRVGSSGLDMSIREVSANPDTKVKDRIQKVMNRVIQELETKLDREIDFEDFLDVNINDTTKGPKWTFDNYSKLKAMWESTGRVAEDIHDDYFSTDLLLDELTDIGFNFVDDQTYTNAVPNSVIESKKEEIKKEVQKNPAPQVEEHTDAEIEDAIEEEYYGDYSNEKIENDKYKNLGNDDGRQTSDSPTPANLGLLYTSDVDGNVIGDVRPNDSPNMNNSVWLNPDELGVGSELVVMPPTSFEEVMDIPVGDWQYNDSTGEWKRHGSISFGELVARDGIVIGSQEYISRVPMKAYTPDGREALWIRDMAWINPNNYSSLINKAEVIKTVRQKTFNIRNTAFQNGKTTIQVTKREFGSYTTFDKMNSAVSNRPEQEVDPTSIPVIATSYNSFKFNGKSYTIGDPNSEIQISNPTLFPGSTYSLRYYGTEVNSNGKRVEKYLAVILRPNIPTKEETLNRNAHNNIKYGVSAVFYMKAFRDYQAGKISKEVLDVVGNRLNMDEVKASHLINSINNTYRVNIESFSRIGTGGMSDFLNNFTAVYTGKKNGNYKDALTSADSERFPDGQAYLYISSNASGDNTSGGQFGINIKGKASTSTQRGDMDDFGGAESYTYPLNPKNGSAKYYDSASKYLESVLGDTGSLSKMRFDPSSQYIGDRSLVLNIDDNGEIQGTSSYDSYVKSNMVTNIAAFKVETSPGVYTYVTDMQPSMAFEQTDSNMDITTQTTTQSIPDPTPESVSTPVPVKVFESLSEEIDNLPEELKDLLGDNPFIGLEKDIFLDNSEPNDLDFSLRELTDSDVTKVESISTNRIKGVDPVQQKIIVQGLYNVILEELGRSDKYDVSALNKLIVKSPEKYLRPELNKTQSAMDKFYADPNLMSQFPKVFNALKVKRNKLTAVLDNQSKITSLEEGNVGDLTNTFQKFFQEEIEESDVQEQDDIIQQDSTGEVEEQYDKDMMTKDITTSFSTDLQIFFSGIPKRDKFNKQEKTFFTGLKEYEDSKNVVGALRAIMANEDSDLNGLMQRLADKSATNPIYIGLHNKLKLAPFKVKMEILYKMNQDRLQMQALLVEKKNGLDVTVVDPNNNESFVAHRIDWSANMVHNGQVTDTLDTGEIVYNKEKVETVIKQAQEIIKDYNEFTKANIKSLGKKLLAGEDIGIPEELNKKLWDFMTVTYGIDISPQAYSQFVRDNFLNLNTKNSKGFLALTLERLNNLNKTLEKQEKVFFDDKRDGLHTNINDLLRSISEVESYYIGNPVPKSFRADGKTYQGTVQKTMVSKLVDKIKDTSSEYFQNLSLIPYSKNNYVLDAISRDGTVKNKFGIRYMGPKALAEKGKKYRKSESRKINALPEADTTLAELGFFAETEGVINYQVVGKEKVKFRLARMFNPTLSDKSQAVFYTIPVVDLRAENIDILDDTLHLDNQVEEFLVEQIFDAELERIVSVLKHKPNISNYKDAGVFFNSIAGFNNIIVEETTAGTTDFVNIISYIHNIVNSDIEQGRETDVESLKTDLRNYALVQMSQALSEEISRKVNDWKRLGIVRGQSVMLSNGETAFAKHLFPNRYFESKNYSFKDDAERNEKEPYLFAADFVINNFLNQNNTYQLIAGDIALYAKGKSKPKEMVEADFETGVITPDGEPVTLKVKNYKLKDVVKFLKTTGENVTKRMAALIAPGSELANSKGDKYIQIFINDVNNATSVSTELIRQAYGEIDKEGLSLINGLNTATDELINIYATVPLKDPTFDKQVSDTNDIINFNRKALADKYPNLGGYFSIDAADAQEYTTWREHLDILMRQGRLDKPERDLVASAYEKLSKGQEVNAEELAVVMNPIKPVYTGPMAEYAKDPITGADILTEPIAMRTVYIKSSSFPLLPQLTAGMALDKTRQHMEHIETKTGKNVRLSYESANKVGHVKSSLTTADLYNFSPEEIFNFNTDTNVFSGKLGEASLILDREFFKIQQDTPNKTLKYLKKGKDNMVTMGSQMWKLLMGNGINVHEALVFPATFDLGLLSILEQELGRDIPREVKRVNGKNVTYVSGVTLDAIKTLVENRYFNTQKEILFTELGLNEAGLSVNPDETKRALKEIIDRELKTGSYPQYATDEIDLSQVDTEDLDFTQPIWMTNNADKFETLLQGIITSRLIKIKMPGNQHISASSEGFWKGKNYTDRGGILGLEDLSPDIQSKIVWTNPSKRGELKPTILKNGKLQASEALIGSHFRMQVQEKDSEGNPILDSRGKPKFKTKLVDLTQAPYSKRDADGYLYLDLNMVDESLLEQFSFRIPTSSHQSGAMLKIVGFLPEAMGDILVVPKEHTVQIGEDFDIDKRNIYKNHYTISKKTGKIQKLSATRFLEPYDAKEFAEAGFLYNMRRINKKIAEDQYLKLISLEHQLEALESVKESKFKEEAATTFLDDDIYELQSQIDGLRDVLLTQDFSSSPEPDKDFKDKITKSKERYIKVVGPMYDKLEKYHKVKAAQKTRTTFYEDSMVNLYKSVFMSPSKDIQNKVNKVLSMDVADNTANAIYNKIFASSDSTGFTTYSDSFQREQQKLGAAGKLGIGQHSNAVTFQAQLERMVSKIKISRDIRLGKLVSDGVLGVSNTLDKQYKIDNNKDIGASRDVADVHTENQNSATDNVKAQIMGKRNENEFTMGVLTMLTYRRFDQDIDPIEEGGSDFYQVPSLFISQPALRKYVEYMEANKAVPNNNVLSPNEVMIKLYNEYLNKLPAQTVREYFNPQLIHESGAIKVTRNNMKFLLTDKAKEELRARMTGEFLYDNLVETSPLMAIASLDLFNELKDESDALTEYQKLINMNTSGLGLSYFEVLDREETLIQMLNDERFENISKLVTNDFMTESQASELSEDELKDYYYVRGYYIKPSTTEGVVLLNSITSANSVINNLYPYKSQGIRRIYSKLQRDSTNLKEDRVRMIRELKDFMLSTSNTGFFEGSVTDERERLMVDAPGKQSLASFLKNMHKRRDDLFMDNDLLKDFRFNLVSQRGYSYINHAAGGKSPSDKNDKAKAFIDLLQDSYTDIGEWNGKRMTPQKLALNLYNYSMLTANDQGISSFREYLPNDLDKIYGLDAYKRSMDAYLKTEDSFEMLDRFYTQFMQHNLDIVPGISAALKSWNEVENNTFTDILFANPNVETNANNFIKNSVNSNSKKKTIKNYLESFAGNLDQFAVSKSYEGRGNTNDRRDTPDVIAVTYKTKTDEGDITGYATYKVTETDDKLFFNKIDGFNSEYYESFYDLDKDQIYKPNVSNTYTQRQTTLGKKEEPKEDFNQFIDPKTGEVSTLESFFGYKPTAKQAIAKVMEVLPENNRLSLLLKTVDSALLEANQPSLEIIEDSVDGTKVHFGAYSHNNNKIYLNNNLVSHIAQEEVLSNMEVIAEVLAEELLHSLQVEALSMYVQFNTDGTYSLYNPSTTPPHVKRILDLYEEAKLKGLDGAEMKNVKEFIAAIYTRPDFRLKLDDSLESWRVKFMQALRQALQDIFEKSAVNLPNGIKPSDYLRENINLLLGDTFRMQDEIAQETLGEGYISNGFRIATGIGVSNTFGRGTNKFITETDDSDYSKKDSFTATQMDGIINKVLSGAPMTILSAGNRDTKAGVAQTALMKALLERVGKIEGTSITSRNASRYFTVDDNGSLVTIKYNKSQQTIKFPDINENCS